MTTNEPRPAFLRLDAGDDAFLAPVARTLVADGDDWPGVARPHLDPAGYAVRQYLKDGSSLEALLLTLYYGEISISQTDTILKSLWGSRAGVGLLAERAPLIEQRIGAWLNREILVRQPYVFLKSMVLKTSKNREAGEALLLLAIGVRESGHREILSVGAAPSSDRRAWYDFLADLKARGLSGTGLFLGDNCPEAVGAVSRHFPGAGYQGSLTQLSREVVNLVPAGYMHETMVKFEAIRETTDAGQGGRHLAELLRLLEDRDNRPAARLVSAAAPLQFCFAAFPAAHWARLRDARVFVPVMQDFRKWIRMSGRGLAGKSLQVVAGAYMRHASRTWGQKKFITFPA